MKKWSAPNFRVVGRRALITGGSRGIGLASAVALAQAGARVTLAARNETDLINAAAELNEIGFSADTLVLDVTDATAVDQALSVREPYQILVNNAGMNRPKLLVDTDNSDIDAVLNLNLKGVLYVCRAVARSLMDRKLPGSFINVSSQMGHVGSPKRTLYCASKHGLEGMTKALAWELGHAGIRVNTLCPTFIETDFTAQMFKDSEFREWVLNKIAVGRLGCVEDVMGAVVFLASDASSLMTGSALMLDGGWTAA